MSFLTPLRYEKVGRRQWRLLEPLRYEVGPGRILEVPAGFVTDCASIPRLFWFTTPPVGDYDAAAVLHDYLYATQLVSRKEADAIFYAALEQSGVGWYTRHKLYLAVRLGGGAAWARYARRKADAEAA